jgi:hypothetical protein
MIGASAAPRAWRAAPLRELQVPGRVQAAALAGVLAALPAALARRLMPAQVLAPALQAPALQLPITAAIRVASLPQDMPCLGGT